MSNIYAELGQEIWQHKLAIQELESRQRQEHNSQARDSLIALSDKIYESESFYLGLTEPDTTQSGWIVRPNHGDCDTCFHGLGAISCSYPGTYKVELVLRSDEEVIRLLEWKSKK